MKTKSFTERKLEEFDNTFDEQFFDEDVGSEDLFPNREKVKAFLSKTRKQAKAEEREKIKEMVESMLAYEGNMEQGYSTGYANGFVGCKKRILSSLNNQDK